MHEAAQVVFAPPPPPPPKPPKLAQQTSPFVQLAELVQVTPGIPVSKAVVASNPELVPELDPEPDPELEVEPELDPLSEAFKPASSFGEEEEGELVDPPHAAANAATQLPTKRSLSILME